MKTILPTRTIDPEGLTSAQRAGVACAGCQKRWPTPFFLVGHLPGGAPVLCCPDCAQGLAA